MVFLADIRPLQFLLRFILHLQRDFFYDLASELCLFTMAYPKNLRVAVDKKNTYVPSDGWQKPYYGNLIEEGGIQHDILCRLTDRVISALKTRRAHAALQEIAEGWRRQYKPDLNAAKAAADFQKLLDDPSDDHRFWATIIIAWKMAPQVGGGHLRKTPLNVEEPEFLFSFQYIGLNGVVSTLGV